MTIYRIHEPGGYFDIDADMAQAAAPVWVRYEGDSGFGPTVFQTADGRHDIDEIAQLIIESEQGVSDPEYHVEDVEGHVVAKFDSSGEARDEVERREFLDTYC